MNDEKEIDVNGKMNHFFPVITKGNNERNITTECEKEGGTSKEEKHPKPKAYVVIYNISKKKNVGSMIRSCVAFNVHKIFIVGKKEKKGINFFGNMGTYKYINIEYFSSIIELKDYLKKNYILLYGCEITKHSISVTKRPFLKDTAFLFGNEGTGIDDSILELCDEVIYIPQYGNGTSSLNVSVCCSIILHNFAIWANYEETEIKEKKFIVQKCANKLDQYLNPTEDLLKKINEKRFTRTKKKEESVLFSLDDLSLCN